MTLPQQPVTLSVAEIEALNKKLADLRHDINGFLSVMLASSELMRLRPDIADRMFKSLTEQPEKISLCLKSFSADLEQALKIVRD